MGCGGGWVDQGDVCFEGTNDGGELVEQQVVVGVDGVQKQHVERVDDLGRNP